MATENLIQNLIGRGLSPQEAGLYAYFAPRYNKPGMSISELGDTIFLNHFSPQANLANSQGRVAAGTQYDPIGNITAGTMPNGYSPGSVTDGPVINAGVQNAIGPPGTQRVVNGGQSGGLFGSSMGLPPGNTTQSPAPAQYPTANPLSPSPATTPSRGLPPAPAPSNWGGNAVTTQGTPSGSNTGAAPYNTGDYSAPWTLGGAWSGVVSHPQYGKGLLGNAGASTSPAQPYVNAAIERAKAAYGSGSGGQDGVSNTNSIDPSGGQFATSAPSAIDGTKQTFQLPGSPAYTSRQFLQTYNGQAAPYANEHQQIFDALRGVAPLAPTFANYGVPQNGARIVAEAATQGAPKMLGNMGRYLPGIK